MYSLSKYLRDGLNLCFGFCKYITIFAANKCASSILWWNSNSQPLPRVSSHNHQTRASARLRHYNTSRLPSILFNYKKPKLEHAKKSFFPTGGISFFKLTEIYWTFCGSNQARRVYGLFLTKFSLTIVLKSKTCSCISVTRQLAYFLKLFDHLCTTTTSCPIAYTFANLCSKVCPTTRLSFKKWPKTVDIWPKW